MALTNKAFDEIMDSLEKMNDRQLQQVITKGIKEKKFTGIYKTKLARVNNINLEEHMKNAGMGHICPRCGSTLIVSTGRRENGVQRLKCQSCGHRFTYFTDTILEKTKYTWDGWIEVVYLMLQNASVDTIKANLEASYLVPSIHRQTILL